MIELVTILLSLVSRVKVDFFFSTMISIDIFLKITCVFDDFEGTVPGYAVVVNKI